MSIARHHAEWLSLLEISGPFLSLPVLLRVFPQGLDEDDPDHRRELRLAYEEWLDNQFGLQPDPAIHRAWVRYVLTQTLQLPDEVLAEGQAIPPTLKATIAEQQETLRPDMIVYSSEFGVQSLEFGVQSSEPGTRNPEPRTLNPEPRTLNPEPGTLNPEPGTRNPELNTRLLIQIVPATQSLDKPLADHHWKASPETRMMELLHASNVRLGLVTNGEQWLLVNAPRGETTGFISWYAELWLEEKITLRAFRSLLGVHRFFSVAEAETLEAMLAQSQDEQHEVTDQLGYQVRRAVEVLVQAIDLADRDRASPLKGGRGGLLADVSEAELYEAALTVMMRLVFLFSAEERGLFPLDDDLYNQYYAASTLRAQLREAADQFGEEVIERRLDAWCRLLTVFRAIHSGIEHDRLRLPAYGGSLFDPDRFEFLEGRRKGSSWLSTPADPLPINNRTVLHLLEALQLLQVRVPGGGPAEARRLSFRALDIEQIGHVYESLLDHTAVRAETVVLGLAGAKRQEPEIPLATLEAFLEQGTRSGGAAEQGRNEKALLDFLKEQTGRSESALKKALVNNSSSTIHNSQLLRAACGNDDSLYQRVLPFAGLLREDDLGQPIVILPGSVYVTAGAERRATGTHYTPRSLTEPIVQHTLEPLVYHGPAEGLPPEQWSLKSPADLLNLKICDMAMGSGAFLVQACRYLSERLVEAWEEVESSEFKVQSSKFRVQSSKTRNSELRTQNPELRTQNPELRTQNPELRTQNPELRTQNPELRTRNLITPEGQPTPNPDLAIPPNTEERLIFARRLVADRCLYGVDKNPLAVEMAKLSLWLITLDKNRPFTFLDHALKCGDSLVGVNLDQLTTWSLEGEGERRFETMTIQAQIDRMVALRRKLETIPVNSRADQEHKRLLFEEAEAIANDLRQGGDMLIGSYFNDLKADEQEYLRTALLLAFRDGQDVPPDRARQADLGNLHPFHWPLEFPEVFLAEGRSGFDAFIGNPPFLQGSRISSRLGEKYQSLLASIRDIHGNADLVVHFLRATYELAKDLGYVGLITTKTISKGDARQSGLDKVIEVGGNIVSAVSELPWPGQASVYISLLLIVKGLWKGKRYLNGVQVAYISSFLDDQSALPDPYKLSVNRTPSFTGSKLYGEGFLVGEEEARKLISLRKINRNVLFPLMRGNDIMSNPNLLASAWTINFKEMDFEEALQFVEPMAIVKEKVFPERQKVKRRHTRDKWWQYEHYRAPLYGSIENLSKVLVHGYTTKYLAFAFVDSNQVFAAPLTVIPTDRYSTFSNLQSDIHGVWAWRYSPTRETRLVYTPSDCLDTFPSLISEETKLNELGKAYYNYRSTTMLNHQEGLTGIYNRFHNPEETAADIARLRELHVQMDQAVATAYGWSDLALGHGFHETAQGVRFTISEPARREVLGRLLALNHSRYEEEVKAGLHTKGRAKGKKQGSGGAGEPGSEGQLSLF